MPLRRTTHLPEARGGLKSRRELNAHLEPHQGRFRRPPLPLFALGLVRSKTRTDAGRRRATPALAAGRRDVRRVDGDYGSRRLQWPRSVLLILRCSVVFAEVAQLVVLGVPSGRALHGGRRLAGRQRPLGVAPCGAAWRLGRGAAGERRIEEEIARTLLQRLHRPGQRQLPRGLLRNERRLRERQVPEMRRYDERISELVLSEELRIGAGREGRINGLVEVVELHPLLGVPRDGRARRGPALLLEPLGLSLGGGHPLEEVRALVVPAAVHRGLGAGLRQTSLALLLRMARLLEGRGPHGPLRLTVGSGG
mmetsp:Transcript_13932/g.40120  ORF Transcript_13932/g.40120 Transcript_13932/m.40120 type:complete len:309 (-) Transcript_13932:53-979(-)